MTRGLALLIGLVLLGMTAAVMQAAPVRKRAENQTPMPAACQEVLNDLDAMDVRLDEHVKRMNESQGTEKIDAMAAAVNEIAAEHRTMREHMASMPGCCRMEHGSGCPMGR